MNPNILRNAAAALRRGDKRPDLSDTLHEWATVLEERATLQKSGKSKKQRTLPLVEDS